jgi:hypothetical protein
VSTPKHLTLAWLAGLGGIAGMLAATVAIAVLYRHHPDRDAPAGLVALFGGALLLALLGNELRLRRRAQKSSGSEPD